MANKREKKSTSRLPFAILPNAVFSSYKLEISHGMTTSILKLQELAIKGTETARYHGNNYNTIRLRLLRLSADEMNKDKRAEGTLVVYTAKLDEKGENEGEGKTERNSSLIKKKREKRKKGGREKERKKEKKNKKGRRKGKQENISHLTPTVTTSASHSGFNVL